MSANKFTDEFKRDAVAQLVDPGDPVCEVAERLGVRCPASECEVIAEREHQVDLHLAKAVFAAGEGDPGGRCSGRRDSSPQTRSGQGQGGKGHIKKGDRVLRQGFPLSRFASKPLPGSGSMQGRTYTELPLQALLMAVWRRKPKTKVHVHSDQGAQFTR
jgi:hypothetical protein